MRHLFLISVLFCFLSCTNSSKSSPPSEVTSEYTGGKMTFWDDSTRRAITVFPGDNQYSIDGTVYTGQFSSTTPGKLTVLSHDNIASITVNDSLVQSYTDGDYDTWYHLKWSPTLEPSGDGKYVVVRWSAESGGQRRAWDVVQYARMTNEELFAKSLRTEE